MNKWFCVTASAVLSVCVFAADNRRMAPKSLCTVIKPMEYGTEGEDFLKAGLFVHPMVMDYDLDGDLDIVLSSGGRPRWFGTWFFSNPGGVKPVFSKPKRISKKKLGFNAQTLKDGRLVVTGEGGRCFNYREKPVFERFAGLPDNVHSNRVRGNIWRYADLDGDGLDDLLVGVGDWTEYGWENAWNAAGEWMRGPLRGIFYFIRNVSGANAEKWAKPEILRRVDGVPLDVYGTPSPLFEDWDGDGDLDLISCDFVDGYTYFENAGTKNKPRFILGANIVDKFAKPIHADLCMVTATAADWDGDGLMDVIAVEEDGRVAWIRNTGRKNAGTLVFDAPCFFRQKRDRMKFGILNTPCVCDLDGDGDQDIVAGNSAGYVAFIENVSGSNVPMPKWEVPRLIEADGAPIRLMAGYNGSVQGPCERKWGYTCLSVADWDGDGLLDIMLNSIRGEIVWCRNVGTKTKMAFSPPEPVSVEWDGAQPEMKYGWLRPNGSKNLLTQWRTTPCMIDWDGDGLMDLVVSDTEGYLAFFRRSKKGEKLVLMPPQRVFVSEDGSPMGFTGWAGNGKGIGGNTGRRKFCFTDWDGDGKLDIIANSNSLAVYRQMENKEGKWFFRNEGDVIAEKMAGHSTCPAPCDFDGDGIEDLVIGAEDGYFYFAPNPRSK